MLKPISTLVAAAALVAACATSASADGWKFTVTESDVGPFGTCNAPTWVPCTVTRDPHVPYPLATLTVKPGAAVVDFVQEINGAVADDDHALMSFVTDPSVRGLNINIDLTQPQLQSVDTPLEINIGLNVTPQKRALNGIIDVAYRARGFIFMSMQGYNNLWFGYWVTRLDGNVHQFVARSEWIP